MPHTLVSSPMQRAVVPLLQQLPRRYVSSPVTISCVGVGAAGGFLFGLLDTRNDDFFLGPALWGASGGAIAGLMWPLTLPLLAGDANGAVGVGFARYYGVYVDIARRGGPRERDRRASDP